jgi:hypothetical protein
MYHDPDKINSALEVCLSMLSGPRPFRTVGRYFERLERDEYWTEEELEEVSRQALAALNRFSQRGVSVP